MISTREYATSELQLNWQLCFYCCQSLLQRQPTKVPWKTETNKVNQNPSITMHKCDLLTPKSWTFKDPLQMNENSEKHKTLQKRGHDKIYYVGKVCTVSMQAQIATFHTWNVALQHSRFWAENSEMRLAYLCAEVGRRILTFDFMCNMPKILPFYGKKLWKDGTFSCV